MFDVFYLGTTAPKLFVHERAADNVDHARSICRTRYLWIVNCDSDYSTHDWLWEPPPWQSQQCHAWASQWQKDSATYLVPRLGYEHINYHPLPMILRRPTNALWQIPNGIGTDAFDWTWHPDETDPAYIYQFGTQHQATGGPRYVVPGATEIKYVMLPRAAKTTQDAHWVVPENMNTDAFDWTWHPDDRDPAYIYQFGTQHQATGGPRYVVPTATEIKYVMLPRAAKTTQDAHWVVPENMNTDAFDWTWHPDDRDPPYRYQFPTQWNRAGGPEYVSPGARLIKFVTIQTARMLPTDHNWLIPDSIDTNSFDFSWTPDVTELAYIYQFGTQHQRTGGPRYVVPGATEVKYITTPRAAKTTQDAHWVIPNGAATETFDWTWHPDNTDSAYIYQFGTQHQRTGGPRYVVPGATEVKYITTPRAVKTTQDAHWVVPSGAATETFDWTWHPDNTDSAYIYQFGTQHQRTGGPRYEMPTATEVKYVDQIRIKTQSVATAIVEIDHMDGNAGQIADTTKTSRYFDNYLDTLKRIAKNLDHQHEFAWICSSICDYTDFDFSWHPEQWQATMLHVFASDGEKFGDTFFMHVPSFQYRADRCELLEWYDVNFVDTVSVPRRPMPVIQHSSDSHVSEIQTRTWTGPLAVFSTVPCDSRGLPAVPLWREKTKTVMPLDTGSHTVIVPKNAVPCIRTQVYDYAWIDRSRRSTLQCAPLDTVFISNGEPDAEHNHDVLQQCLARHQATNVVHRITNVQGRVACYQAAARASATDWFFAVFAKLEVNEDFDWSWQPDRLQQAKHYIFHAYNPVNHLVYGHQAMIAYNRRLVLRNPGRGLDFTLDDPHEVVPILSGTACYDSDAWTCWRTAFREVIKLRHSLPDVENEYRLEQWLTPNDWHDHARWSHIGADDAIKYYESVAGDFVELRKSYDWQWLAAYAMMIQPSLIIKI